MTILPARIATPFDFIAALPSRKLTRFASWDLRPLRPVSLSGLGFPIMAESFGGETAWPRCWTLDPQPSIPTLERSSLALEICLPAALSRRRRRSPKLFVWGTNQAR